MRKKYNPVLVGIIIAVVVFLYMMGPIDFLPDFIGGFGQIDDGVVLTLGMIAELINIFLGFNLALSKEFAEEYCERPYEEGGFGEYREI